MERTDNVCRGCSAPTKRRQARRHDEAQNSEPTALASADQPERYECHAIPHQIWVGLWGLWNTTLYRSVLYGYRG